MLRAEDNKTLEIYRRANGNLQSFAFLEETEKNNYKRKRKRIPSNFYNLG